MGLYTIVLVVSGYALLPWWLPKDTIRERLVEQLADDLGRAVSIEGLTISWAGGVEITGLAVGRRDGQGYLLKVDKLTSPFAPLALARGRVGHLTVEGADAYVISDSEGQWNMPDLGQGRSGVTIDGIGFHRVRVHVVSDGATSTEGEGGPVDQGASEWVVEIEGDIGETSGGKRIEWGTAGAHRRCGGSGDYESRLGGETRPG